ncbi:MAG: deoxyribonuclease IV [Candidatus Poribacteria bacterium]|nr:deoxyribonuclease IV [Candidatus Poribacteria bacterium]
MGAERNAVEPRIGAHIRADKGFHGVFQYAEEWDADVIQIFTASPRSYRAKPLTADRIDPYMAAWERAGKPLVISHASYLANLASPKDDVRKRAADAFANELVRCEAMAIPHVVLHMGSRLTSQPEEAGERLAEELNRLAAEVDSTTRILLENAAGQGSSIGRTFGEIGAALSLLKPAERFGVCIDTCHLFAAGYDLRGDGFEAVWAEFEEHVGFDRLFALHLNDSKGELGSCIDRHEHIGEGHIGEEPFRRLFADSRLRSVPCYIETPDDLKSHPLNLSRLRSLAAS